MIGQSLGVLVVNAQILSFGVVDLVLAALFMMAYLRTAPITGMSA